MEDREIVERLLPTDDELKAEILSRIATRISGVRHYDPDTGEEYYDEALVGAVRSEAIKMAHEAIKAKVDAIVEAALNEGFVPTNQWGEAKSAERVTLREMVAREAKSWLERPKDNYGSGGKTPLQILIADIIGKVWTKELEKEAVACATQVKAGINEKLTSKITEAVAALLRDPARK